MQPFDQDFFNHVFLSNSVVLDRFFENGERILSRLLFRNEYVDTSYLVSAEVGRFRIERKVANKWELLKHLGNSQYNLDALTDLISSELNGIKNTTHFECAPHGDWPGYFLHQRPFGSSVLFGSVNEVTFPQSVYDLKQDQIRENDEDFKAIEREYGVELRYLSAFKGGVVFIFLNDKASIYEWKIYQNKIKGTEGIVIRLHVNLSAFPVPKLSLRVDLIGENESKLLSVEKKIDDEFDLIHRFESEMPQEIYRCSVRLFDGDDLIDNYSGVPVRKIEVQLKIMGQKDE